MRETRRNPDVDRFDRWGPAYERSSSQRWYFDPVHARMLDLLARAWKDAPPRTLLDLGCGTGRLLADAQARWPGMRLTGVDPAEGMLREARRLHPGIDFFAGPAEDLAFPDGSFDCVTTSLSFHHWADQPRGIREAARVLRPGGWFCIADHSLLITRWFGEKGMRTRREILEILQGAGLRPGTERTLPFRFVRIMLANR